MKPYDNTFITKLQQQDPDAFGTLYSDFVDIFYRYMKSHYTLDEAHMQDLLSDIFVKIRDALPRITTQATVSGFLRTIAKNHIKDFFKRSSDIPFGSFSSSSLDDDDMAREDMLPDTINILETTDTQHTYDAIHTVIQSLENIYKEPLLLKFTEEMSYEEIALVLGITQEVVRKRVSRALKKIEEKLAHIK